MKVIYIVSRSRDRPACGNHRWSRWGSEGGDIWEDKKIIPKLGLFFYFNWVFCVSMTFSIKSWNCGRSSFHLMAIAWTLFPLTIIRNLSLTRKYTKGNIIPNPNIHRVKIPRMSHSAFHFVATSTESTFWRLIITSFPLIIFFDFPMILSE